MKLLLWLIVGFLLGNVATAVFVYALGYENGMAYGQLVAYPLIFLPYMLKIKRDGKLDDGHFAPVGAAGCIIVALIGTFAAGFVLDCFSEILPPMPDSLKEALDSVTGGSFALNFVLVSIMAPFFEEWLCRGTILRWMLDDGVKPSVAILLSSLFFGLIHANIWQAIPAVGIGLLMGFFYYRTRSLKLMMLMHSFNNTVSLVVTRIDVLDQSDSWVQVLGTTSYIPLAIVATALVIASVAVILKVKAC